MSGIIRHKGNDKGDFIMNEEKELLLKEQMASLKKAVNRTADWAARLEAVQTLAKMKSEEAMNILQFVAKNEHVTKVREVAAKAIKQNGGTAPTYELPRFGYFKDLRKVFLRIKKSLPKDHTYEDFKVKLEKMRIDIYNTYEGEKGADFDAWLEDMWKTTTTQK
jgi:HEAT repeat protein